MDNSRNTAPQPEQAPQQIQDIQQPQVQQIIIPSGIAADMKFCRTTGNILGILLVVILVLNFLTYIFAFFMSLITTHPSPGTKIFIEFMHTIPLLTIFGFAGGAAFAHQLVTVDRVATLTLLKIKRILRVVWLLPLCMFIPLSLVVLLMTLAGVALGSVSLSISLVISIWAVWRYTKVLRYFRNSKEV